MIADESSPDVKAVARAETLAALATINDEGWSAIGVSLYVVVAPGSTLAPEMDESPNKHRFWAQPRDLSDRLLYHITEPAMLNDGEVPQPEYPLHEVPQLLASMFNEVYTRQPDLRSGGVQYVIAQIQELRAPLVAKDKQQQWQKEPWKREKVARVVTVYLRGILDMFDQAHIGTPRGYFDHYDYVTGNTGHIAFGRTAAVLGGLSDTQLRTFINQLSCGEMASEGGLTRATFVPVLTLIGQWNGNQDVRSNVDLVQENIALAEKNVSLAEKNAALAQQNVALVQQNIGQVQQLRHSGDDALKGTIWISYALAVIGVATALLNYMKDPLLISPGTLLLGASCVFNAFFATRGNRVMYVNAQALFWLGLVLALAGGAANFAHLPLPSFIPGKTS